MIGEEGGSGSIGGVEQSHDSFRWMGAALGGGSGRRWHCWWSLMGTIMVLGMFVDL